METARAVHSRAAAAHVVDMKNNDHPRPFLDTVREAAVVLGMLNAAAKLVEIVSGIFGQCYLARMQRPPRGGPRDRRVGGGGGGRVACRVRCPIQEPIGRPVVIDNCSQ